MPRIPAVSDSTSRILIISIGVSAALIVSFATANFGAIGIACVLSVAALSVIMLNPIVGVVAMGFLYPLVFISIHDYGYTVAMNSFRIVALLTFVAWIVRTIFLRNHYDFSSLKWFLLLLAVGSLLATIRSNEFLEAEQLQGIKILKYGMYISIFLLIYNSIQRVEHIKWFIVFFVASIFLLSILSYIQYFTNVPIIYENDANYEGLSPSSRLFLGIGANPNVTANIFIFGIAFVLNAFIQARRPHIKMIMLLLVVCLAGTILLTQSRTAIFGLIAAQLFVQFTTRTRFTKHLVMLIISGVAFYIICDYMAGYLVSERFTAADIMGHGLEYRIKQAAATVRLAVDYPFGIGQEYYEIIGRYGGIANASPHNMFLESYVMAGLLGFAGYALLVMVNIYTLWKTKIDEQDKSLSIIKASLLCGLIAYVIHNQFHHLLWEYPLWIFLGISMSVCKIADREKRKKTGNAIEEGKDDRGMLLDWSRKKLERVEV